MPAQTDIDTALIRGDEPAWLAKVLGYENEYLGFLIEESGRTGTLIFLSQEQALAFIEREPLLNLELVPGTAKQLLMNLAGNGVDCLFVMPDGGLVTVLGVIDEKELGFNADE